MLPRPPYERSRGTEGRIRLLLAKLIGGPDFGAATSFRARFIPRAAGVGIGRFLTTPSPSRQSARAQRDNDFPMRVARRNRPGPDSRAFGDDFIGQAERGGTRFKKHDERATCFVVPATS